MSRLRATIAVCEVAAEVGDEAGEGVLAELQHVGRRNVVRHHDQSRSLGAALAARRVAAPPVSALSTRSPTCCDVVLALAQIGVLDLVELRDQLVHLLRSAHSAL